MHELLASDFAYIWVQTGKILALWECKDNSPALHVASSHPYDTGPLGAGQSRALV